MTTTAVRTHKAEPIVGSEWFRGPDAAMRAECKDCGRDIEQVVYGEWDGEKAASYWRHVK